MLLASFLFDYISFVTKLNHLERMDRSFFQKKQNLLLKVFFVKSYIGIEFFDTREERIFCKT